MTAAASTPTPARTWRGRGHRLLLVVTSLVLTGIAGIAGTNLSPAGAATPTAPLAHPASFWLTSPSGSTTAFGAAPAVGGLTSPPTHPIVGVAASSDALGLWMVASDGGIFAFGDARFLGSTGAISLNKPIVGMAATPTDQGYWLVASDGGIFAFGDARFFGSTGAMTLNEPIVGMAPTPSGRGYWLVASDGGIFTFGDATFFGSTGAIHLNKPITSMTAAPGGAGYWLLAADGGVFNFGAAPFLGSTGDAPTADPPQRIVSSRTGRGYWIVDQNGTDHAFGDAVGATPPTQALLFQNVTPGDRAVAFAFTQLGKPYVWGGNGPAGYDCSGLALASWEAGAAIGFARVASAQYATAGTPVALSDLAAGDLVFWGSSQTDPTSVYHTAIYVGGGRIVEATGNAVQLNSLGQWGWSGVMPNGRRP